MCVIYNIRTAKLRNLRSEIGIFVNTGDFVQSVHLRLRYLDQLRGVYIICYNNDDSVTGDLDRLTVYGLKLFGDLGVRKSGEIWKFSG